MKDPKALFPFLFASSWLGNFLLTFLACYLAFTSDGPLTPLLFTTVAVCILSGNLLPVSVYLITVKLRRLELEAQSNEVSWRVQEALKRSEDVLNRLDEAEGSLAKGILVARQVPERIREALENVHQLAEKVNALEVGTFVEAIESQTQSLLSIKGSVDDLAKAVGTAEADIAIIGKDVKSVSKSQSSLLETVKVPAPKKTGNEFEVSVAERLDLVYESLENVQDSLDGLLARLAAGAVPAAGEPVAGKERDGRDDSDVDVDTDVDTDGDTDVDRNSGHEEEEPFELSDGRTRLIAHAMIGMHNKMYIRGDQPWLSWEDGQQMELIGIGEFAWSIDNLKAPIEVTVLINDEYAAEQGTVVLQPGKTVRIHPRFPKT